MQFNEMKNLREEVEFFLKGKSRLEVMLYLSLAKELQKERELKSIQNKTEAIGRELELERERISKSGTHYNVTR